jgi:hypothetical protein
MADYTEADLKRARGIVDSLASGARGRGDREYKFRGDIEDGLSIADLETHAEQFYNELNTIDYLGLNFPAISIDGATIPVALSEALPDNSGWVPGWTTVWRRFLPPGYFSEQLYNELRRGMRRFGEEIRWLPGREADETFVARASEFLASRIAGRRAFGDGASLPPDGPPPIKFNMQKFIGGPPTHVVGCSFSVHTCSANLSAYWSGAYLIRSNYHGAPTTPAVGPLQAGTYVFGINGGAYGTKVQWDTNKVCTLPGMNSVRLQY